MFLDTAADMDGDTRLEDGSIDTAGRWEYGRLEIFARGFWSNVCNEDNFPPDSVKVACKALGYAGGTVLTKTSRRFSFVRLSDLM